jgi:hypothetical protein
MLRLIKQNEALAIRRRLYFHLVGTNGITPVLTEAGGQPQYSINGSAWTTVGFSTLTAIGGGRYFADLARTVVANPGDEIETQYASINTATCPGDSALVVNYDPFSGAFDVGEGSVLVDHNFGAPDALAYVDSHGNGIEAASIRCYLAADYNLGNYSSDFVVASTQTNFNGEWVHPMMLDPANYTLIYFKQGDFGPDRRDITVS